jgi:glycosyltransferase involved in cell wall biosynthesis
VLRDLGDHMLVRLGRASAPWASARRRLTGRSADEDDHRVPRAEVSIILPTFKRLSYLRSAIESVFAQTFDDWDLIIADDGSDEETRAYLRGLENRPRLKVLLMPHVGNPAAVRNAGLRHATGARVAFLDSDDLWAPRKLELQVAALAARPRCLWSYTAFTRVDAAGRLLPDEYRPRWMAYDGDIFEQLVVDVGPLRTPSVLVSRRLVDEVGGFDQALRSGEDYDLWLRLALRSPVTMVDEPLVQVRLHEQNHSRDWAAAYHGRDQSLRKLQDWVATAERRALLRRERANNAAGLLRQHAARGEAEQVVRSLLRTAPYGWRYTDWWRGAAGATLRLYRANRARP